MYAKLILRSARRSARDYLIYLVTMTLCVALFYAFLSVSSRFYKPDIGVEYDFTLLSGGMKMAICAVTLLLLFLIRFVNHYMLRSRQKEFALEAILGMDQRTIAGLFFAETLLMGGVSVVLGIGLGAVCSQFITALLLAWTAVWAVRRWKGDFPVLVLGLTAGALVCILAAASVPVVQRRYMLAFGEGGVSQALTALLVHLLFLLCGVIWLASTLLVWRKERSVACRYQGTNLFFFGQMISKLRTTSKTMSLVSITLVLSIFLFMAAPVLVGWADGYLEARSMYDIQIYSRYNNVYHEADLPRDGYQALTAFLSEKGIETAADRTFSLYLPRREDFHQRVKYDFPAAVISLSDYNALRTMLGLEPVELAEGEFTTQWQTIASEEEREQFLAEHPTVSTDAGVLTLAEQAWHDDPMGETLYNSYTDVVYVFPDSVCQQLLPVMRCRYSMTAQPLAYETARALEQFFVDHYPEQAPGGVNYSIRLRTLQVNSTRAGNFVLQAAMIYGAVVLMVICLTVLSLQQLLDAGQYRYRFSVLRKLGVGEKEIGRLVVRQLGFWFGLPVGAAALAGGAVVGCFVLVVQAEIGAYIGFGALAVQLGITAAVLTLLLGCYFVSTWAMFRRAIEA